MLVANSSAVRGIVPHNITVGSEVEQQLGSGCHQLTLHASVLGVSTELQVEPTAASQRPETFENGSMQVYNISTTIQGYLQVKVRSWIVFSHMDVDNTAVVCHNSSDLRQKSI